MEIKHTKLFNTHPGHTVHVDFFELNHKDYLIMVDRLTGFARCQATKNEGTDEAIAAIKNWGDLHGYPYKIIADGGPAFREDFTEKLLTLNIGHVPSSAYHPQSNSLAERGVLSVKNGLKKSAVKLTAGHLNELVFAINTTTSSEGTGSPADRFFGRLIRSRLPNSVDPGINSDKLIRQRIEKHDAMISDKNKRNKIVYQVVQRVRLQNVATRDWDLKGTVERLRYADDGRVVSYYIMTDRNHLTTRHRRFMKPLHVDHDPKIVTNKNIDTQNYARTMADSPNAMSVAPRRSGRPKPSTRQAIKCITMGSEFSNFSTPFTANIELSFGGNDDVVTVREVRRNVHNGMANRPGQQGVQGTERQAGGGAQQRHTSQTVERVNGAGGSVATGRSQQRQGGQEDLGGATGS